MIQQTKQVAYTYLTYRWIWFLIAILMAFLLPGFLSDDSPIAIPLGLPCMMGMTFLVAVTKWQFANPRARLIPNFARWHLSIFGAILLSLFVISPLVLAAFRGIHPIGPLSFTLLLGGCTLYCILLNRGYTMLPSLVIFFSGFSSATAYFWFEQAHDFYWCHSILVVFGGGLVAYCLWFLSQLTEEMDEYQTLPIAGINASRLERAEQRRLVGRQAKKQKILSWISDWWLDVNLPQKRDAGRNTLLIQYGIARTPASLATFTAGIAFTIYGLLLLQLDVLRSSDVTSTENFPNLMLILFAVGVPAAIPGFLIMQHRPRMSHELLRPASRDSYFNNFIVSHAIRVVLTWLGTHIGLSVLAIASDTIPLQNTLAVVAAFLALSLTMQIPAFGFLLRLSLENSFLGYILGTYFVIAVQIGTLALWWADRFAPSPILLSTLLATHCALGIWSILWARRNWLAAELGQ